MGAALNLDFSDSVWIGTSAQRADPSPVRRIGLAIWRSWVKPRWGRPKLNHKVDPNTVWVAHPGQALARLTLPIKALSGPITVQSDPLPR